MKNLKLRWLFYFVLLGLCLQAQVNNQFKLQLYLADQNGNIYVNRNIGLKISILKSENDFPIYSERQVLTSDATGLLNISIGAGTNSVGNIASFSQLTAGFIKIEYDPSGGSNYTRMLLQPLVSVPYASISNYALGLKGRGITGNHFADSSILAENLDFNPAKKEDVEVLKSWIDTYTNGSIPTLITYLSSPNVIDTAQILAIVSSDGGDSISEKGFVYSLSPNPTINNLRLKAGRGNANFSGVLKGLNASSTYHVRSYAMNRLGIGYGNPITITTASPVSSPTLTTTSASSILETSATTGGNVTSDGGATVTERGVVYAISGIPSLSNSKIVAGTSGTGTYTVNLAGLTGSTKYYFRAYATNSVGTGYGALDSFVTLTPVVLPTISTISASSILETSATTGGNVISDGGATLTERGVVYATSGLPSITDNKVVADSTSTDTFTVNLTGLSSAATYYFRAYAKNSVGTGYGTLDSFVTLTPVVLPTLTTISASSILETSATTGGNVTSDGGATVTERGVVYVTSGIPSLTDSKVVAGTSGTGTYTVNLTGLTSSTKYYFRAYATNSVGTGYGSLDSFVTLTPVVLPTLTTTSASSILETSAITGGNVTSDGGAAITERGVVYATSGLPSITDNKVVADTAGTDTFTVNLTGLTGSNSYFFRAYATNSAGTGYGSLDSFMTLTPVVLPTLTTTSASSILENSAITGGNVTSDGGAAITERGVVYATSGLPSITDNKIVADTAGIDTFTVNLTGLTGSTKYYFRAYATNSAGTGYGTLDSFVTLTPVVLPTVSTTSASSILATSAVTGGNVTSDGGATVTERGVVYATSGLPSITDIKVVADTAGIDTFTVNLTGLTGSTKYYFRAYATNSAGTGFGTLDSLNTPLNSCTSDTIKDIDGNIYNTVSIGSQCWTKENLRVSKYNDGTPVPLDNSGGILGTGPDETWSFKASGARTIYAHSQENFSDYGYLYNWFAARGIASAGDTNYKNLCPIGWHIPTIEEGVTLSNFLGGYNIAGGKLKSAGTTLWKSPNMSATNLSGFSGLPGGSRINYIGRFESVGSTGFWWFSSGVPNIVDGMSLMFDESSVGLFKGNIGENGHSVRCLKDTLTISMTLNIPSLTTIEADSIKTTSIRSGGNISSDGGCSLTDRGLVWDTSPNPTIVLSTKTWNGSGIGRFTLEITDLNPNTTYYIRAYASNCRGIAYGNELSLSTASTVPTLTTTAADSINPTTARSGGNISSDGGATVTERGVVWSTSPTPTISLGTKTSNGTGIGSFNSHITGLSPNTTFYIRAYATNSAGTGYGNEVSFTTTAASQGIPCPGVPTVTDIDGNVYNTVSIGSQCWTKENLRVTRYKDGTLIPIDTTGGTAGNGSGQTWSNLTTGARSVYGNDVNNLSSYGYLYNWYAASNSKGLCPTGWHVPVDNDIWKLTSDLGHSIAGERLMSNIGWSSLSNASNDSGFSGLPGGMRFYSDGSYYFLNTNGFFWSSTEYSFDTNNGFGFQLFIADSVATWNAINSTKSFGYSVRCLRDTGAVTTAMIPTLTTTPASSIFATRAVTGGSVTSDGGATVTERGVVYATSGLPSITDNKVVADTTNTDTFTVNLTGLTGSTTYYFRAYATNSAGTGYGSLDSFVTLTPVVLPTISTTSLSGITTSSATTGGNVTSDGGATVSERGVVWATSSMPTITLSTKTIDGTGTGNFTSAITGIVPNTIYYVRAYATNSAGTVYGNELTFNAVQGVSCPGFSTVTDIDGNIYNTVQIGTQCWTKENLRVTKYSDGTIIPLDSSGGTSGDNTGHSWGFLTSGLHTLNSHSQSNLATYGYLYNWYAAKGIATSGNTSYKNLCPTGWHVPADGEWNTLTTFLGGQNIAGGKMKSSGTSLWRSPNTGATNESGFTGLPGGYRLEDGRFVSLGWNTGAWWSTSENSYSNASLRRLEYNNGNISWNGYPKEFGFSVRCLMDNNNSTSTTSLPTINTNVLSNINASTATSGVNISADGGCPITSLGVVWSTSPNPEISLSTKTSDGTGTGIFISNLTNLKANTTYYIRAYATNCVGTGYGDEISFITTGTSMPESCPGLPNITDIDGNIYNTVQIGTQCWTKENLKVTKYNDGTLIPLDSSGGTTGNGDLTWFRRTSGARTIYAHSQSNFSTYGYLYNWYAVKGIDTTGSTSYKNLCPTGWHVPTDEEWDSLTTFLGGRKIAGGKMKSTGTTLWNSPNIDATNGSGFTGLPGGYRNVFGNFNDVNSGFFFWSASESGSGPWFRYLHNSNSFVYRIYYQFKNVGASVRCLRDTGSVTSAMIPTLTTTPASSILATSAVTGGNVTSDGGATVTERGVVYATSGLPLITDNKVVADTTSTDTFTVNLTGLTGSTTFYFRAYATNSVGTGYGTLDSMTTPINYCPSDTIMDIDGNVYNTVSIGSQCWTKENLRVTKYSDGTSIPLDNSGGTTGDGSGQTWGSRTTGARTIYEHSASNLTTYGFLYNWNAAKGLATTGSTSYKNLCPSGWHVPSDGEWTALTTFLGGTSIAGGKMKSTGTTLWTSPNTGATNESGFTVLPGGSRYKGGNFDNIRIIASFWSATENGNNYAWDRILVDYNGNVSRTSSNETFGASIRCLKDSVSNSSTTVPTLTTTSADSIKSTTARSGGNITSDGGCTITSRGVVWSRGQNPTISLSTKTSDGTDTGSFTSNLTGLIANTMYYVRAYATNCVGTAYGSEVSFTTIQGLPCPGAPIVTDIDGNEYNTVSIGTQCWTKENIRVTKYNDGTAIPLDTSGGILGNGVGETWSSLTTGARSIYGHSENNIPSYGYLYNWFAATDAKGLCPSGWHLPTEAEWIELKNFLGGSFQAAYNMKDVGTTHWNNTDINITNESGFTAMAGGYRHPFDSGNSKGFDGFGTSAIYWSNVGFLYIGEGNTGVNVYNNINGLSFGSGSLKKLGVSVRCLKDAISSNNSTLPTLSTIMVDSISSSTVRSGGNIVSDGGDSVTIRGVVWSIKPNPTISAPSKTWNGSGSGLFMSSITNLSPNTTYYLRAYAINNTGVSYGNELTFLTSSAVNQGVPCSGLPTISDIDGNTYNTVSIGSQCWTRENLKVSRYNDGTNITLDSSGGDLGDSTGHTWGARTIGARTVYGQDSFNLQTYGYLYNWYAAKGIFESDTTNLKNLCPTGWHVPTDGEWTLLSDYLGGESIAGNKLKTTGTAHWIFPNTGSTNESGFSALPGGFRTIWGSFAFLNDDAYFASSSSYDSDFSWFRYLSNNSGNFGRYYSIGNTKKSFGFSIRCLKDSFSTPSSTVPTLTTTAADSVKTTTARSGGNITSDGGCSITARGVVWSTSQNPTISLSTKTSDGTGTGSFTSNLTGLIANTTYYVRAYATNCVGTAYGSEVSFTTTAASQGVACPGVPTITDIDGNTYNTVQIGTQCWTKENLRVTKYSDGTIIPLDSSGGSDGNGAGQTWGSWTTGARTIYAHSLSNLTTYGYLYNWYAAKGIAAPGSTSYKNLCPAGWHVPSNGEWTNLTAFLSGASIAGGKMKSTGTTLWTSPNTGATNESGFTVLPGGCRNYFGSFCNIRYFAFFWSATEDYEGLYAWNRTLHYNNGLVNRYDDNKANGASVRCLKDSISTPSTTLPTITTTAADSVTSTTARSGGNITSDGGCTITASGVVWSTSQNPTIALSTKSSDGTGTGSFTSNLTGLIANTTYYVRSYATNCVGTAYGGEVSFTTTAASQGVPCPGVPTVTDIDGNTYNTVQIGTQCWLKENLRVTKYNDGTYIPLDNSGGKYGDGSGQTWSSWTTGARTIYAHSQSNLATYGYLYNWYAAKGIDSSGSTSYKNLCPTGWHVPSDGEWTALTTYLGGENVAGGKMKSTGTTLWNGTGTPLWTSPNTGATNESGFTGLPGGDRKFDGGFYNVWSIAFFWSATERGFGLGARSRELGRDYGYVSRGESYGYGYRNGFSVRCLKD